MKRCRLLNASFHAVTMEETVGWAREFIRSGGRGHVCTVNVAILMMMRSDPMLQGFVDSASLVLADGQPLVWASRLRGTGLPERVTGVDLVEELCAIASKDGLGVYFLGAHRSVIEEASAKLKTRHPGLQIAGIDDGYFSEEEAPARALAIAKSGAALLFVGMGVPKQEAFLERYLGATGARLAVPVGGSFEVIAGMKRRAPRFLQRMGLEWSYRLCQEPRRLWKRYLVTGLSFLYLIAVDLVLPRRPDGERRERKHG